jgi:hypothetical protein
MAKRTKIAAITNTVVDTTNKVPLESPSVSMVVTDINTNNSNNTKYQVTSEAPSKSNELEQFTVLKDTIIKTDDYIKFIELANKYNLFNKVDLNNLHKQDLICLLGSVINELYQTKDNLTTMRQEEARKKQSSFDKPVSYSDLMGTLGNYKSWN